MAIKPDPRAAASKQILDAREQALAALSLPDGEAQFEAWRKAAFMSGEANRLAILAVRESGKRMEKRKK